MPSKSPPVATAKHLSSCGGGEVLTLRCCAGVALVVKWLRSGIPGAAALVAGQRKKEETVPEQAIIGLWDRQQHRK